MPQRKQLTWTELRVGLFVLAGLFLLAIAIFYVTGAGFIGPKYRLYTYLPEVEGLQVGAPVRLDGVEIGNVDAIELAPHPENPDRNIRLTLRIDQRFKDKIRTDSTASLITEGLLGNRYVTIKRGLVGAVIPQNGEVPGKGGAAMTAMIENIRSLSDELTDMVDRINRGQGTLGKLITDTSLYDRLNGTAGRAESLIASVQKGEGTVGKLVASDELYNRVNHAIGNADDVIGAVRDQKGTIGKLIYDPTFYQETKGVTEKANALFGDIRAGKGSLGKLATDETLYNNLRDASANVRDATAKLNSNEGTAGKFFSDPALYDNMVGLSGDMRLLISDFRQNPKKFLRIKVGIF
jgi:phospholipid/cholesterol/gamma-HCH transport system substrate-binding protein